MDSIKQKASAVVEQKAKKYAYDKTLGQTERVASRLGGKKDIR